MLTTLLGYLRRHHIALLALFVALGGTSYAALRLPRNSVGPRQIREGAVTKDKIARGAVDQKALSPALVAALGSGAAGATGATGPQGPQGSAGGQGPSGANGSNGTNGTNGTNGVDGAPGTARAYAYVGHDSFGNATFRAVKGFTAVNQTPFPGTYCLTPPSGLNLSNSAPVVSVVWDGASSTTETAMVSPPSDAGCPSSDYGLRTQRGVSGVNDLDFTIIVP